MSKKNITSNRTSNKKLYLGASAILALILIYLFLSPSIAQPTTPATTTETATATESMSTMEGWNQFPMSEESKKWLADRNIKSIIFLNEKLEARVADKYGKEASVCGRAVAGATKIDGDCTKLKAATITHATNIFMEMRESSPGWCWTYINGQLYYFPC